MGRLPFSAFFAVLSVFREVGANSKSASATCGRASTEKLLSWAVFPSFHTPPSHGPSLSQSRFSLPFLHPSPAIPQQHHPCSGFRHTDRQHPRPSFASSLLHFSLSHGVHPVAVLARTPLCPPTRRAHKTPRHNRLTDPLRETYTTRADQGRPGQGRPGHTHLTLRPDGSTTVDICDGPGGGKITFC